MTPVETINAAFGRVFGGAVAEAISPVSLNLENRSWLVTCDGRQMVAKFPEARGGLTAGAAIEYQLLELAAEVGVGPTPFGFDAASQVLFVAAVDDARPLEARDALDPERVTDLAATLQRLHSVTAPAVLRSFDVTAFAAHYGACLAGEAATEIRTELGALHRGHAALLAGSTLCHNDLHGANILAGERLWLVDFEYAVRAAPIVDIASYAVFSDLDNAAAMEFAALCLSRAPPFSATQLGAVMRMQRLLAEFWEIARNGNNARL